MKVYKYLPDVNRYDVLRVKKGSKKAIDSIFGDPLTSSWNAVSVKVETETGDFGDFPRLDAHVPVVTERAWIALQPLIGTVVEILPLECDAGVFFALNVLAVEDCLDPVLTEFGRLRNGVIYSIRRHAFRSGIQNLAPIFRLPQVRKDILITDAFRKLVEDAQLVGLLFYPLGSVT